MYFRFPILLILIAAVIGGFFYFGMQQKRVQQDLPIQELVSDNHEADPLAPAVPLLNGGSPNDGVLAEMTALESIQVRFI